MSRDDVAAVARVLLYEGYMLYPYRPSAVKNRQRFNFGVLYPEAYSRRQGGLEPWLTQTECVVLGSADTLLDLEVGFLHLVTRTVALTSAVGASEPVEVDRLLVGDRLYQPWQEAVERRIGVEHLRLGDLAGGAVRRPFVFPESDDRERISGTGGGTAGLVRRRQEALVGAVEVEVRAAGESCYVVTARILNRTDVGPGLDRRDDILARCLVSTHTILTVKHGEFVSLTDPPGELSALVAECRNLNTWPVLAGTRPARDTLLSSPIILYDYPEIAPESAGDLFDGTEIDEILSLRILSLSDDEKREIAQSDERARLLLERTESLAAEQMMSLHGVMRRGREEAGPVSGADARALPTRGARVRLRPRAGGDVFDLALIGKDATVESVEQDLEGNYLVSVVLDEDPGAYLGLMRQPGHRFFFAPEELEILPDDGTSRVPAAPTVLVAGIGNVFLGDDGFGVEVAQRLAARRLPAGVTVADYGIRGYDLAYALVARPDQAILVDACPRGEAPGTLYVLEPDAAEAGAPGDPGFLDGHAMNPMSVLRLARALGGELNPVVVVGCEPLTLGPEEGLMGLSAPVEAAVDDAVTLVESLIARFLASNR